MSKRWWHITWALWLGGGLGSIIGEHLGLHLTGQIILVATVAAYVAHLVVNGAGHEEEEDEVPELLYRVYTKRCWYACPNKEQALWSAQASLLGDPNAGLVRVTGPNFEVFFEKCGNQVVEATEVHEEERRELCQENPDGA